ncbi:MAG: hypothetical protein FWD59_08980 [Micrococcales bacterium]|nr:hypothetical protein [Micrococcales bacterium]
MRQTGRTQAPAWALLAFALVAATVAAGGAAALADAGTPTDYPGALETSWDGPTVTLAWNGTPYETFSDTVIGEPVSIPGDESWRTLNVKNTADCAGFVTVEAFNVLAHMPETTVNDTLPRIIELTWSIEGTTGARTFADIMDDGGTLVLGEFALPLGVTKPVTVGYRFPIDSTEGRNFGFPSTGLTFDVRISIQGDSSLCNLNPNTSTSGPPPSPTQSPEQTKGSQAPLKTGDPTGSQDPRAHETSPSATQGWRPGGGALASTGAAIVGVCGVALAMLLLGVLLRRRRETD